MKVRIIDILLFITAYSLAKGVWCFKYRKAIEVYYRENKDGNETFFDFCIRYFDCLSWRIRKFLNLRKLYTLKNYKKILILRGIFSLFLGIAIAIFIFYVRSTEYRVYLYIKV